jgi:hypothetical protein
MEHRCGTCGQTFPTGQALGGHMRRHRPLSVVGGRRRGNCDMDEGDHIVIVVVAVVRIVF